MWEPGRAPVLSYRASAYPCAQYTRHSRRPVTTALKQRLFPIVIPVALSALVGRPLLVLCGIRSRARSQTPESDPVIYRARYSAYIYFDFARFWPKSRFRDTLFTILCDFLRALAKSPVQTIYKRRSESCIIPATQTPLQIIKHNRNICIRYRGISRYSCRIANFVCAQAHPEWPPSLTAMISQPNCDLAPQSETA